MAAQWLRLWHDMPNDPKWRTIARASKQSIGNVIAVYVHVMVNASANASERGRTKSLCSEDIASALDIDTSAVDEILSAMQGRVLENDCLSGWNKRQPEREDGSAERAKAWRENAKKTHANASERKSNAPKRSDTDTDTDTDTEKNLSFDRFWNAYPRSDGRKAALKAFTKINPGEELLGAMLAAVKRQAASESWTKDDGKFVPMASTWLNGERWTDGVKTAPTETPDYLVGAV